MEAQLHTQIYQQTPAHSSSHAFKAFTVSLLITFPSAVFSFLHSFTCPYLPSLSSPERPPRTRDKENRRGGKKEHQQGGMRKERRRGEAERSQRIGRFIRDSTYTHLCSHTGAIVLWFCCGALWSHRQGMMNVWPLFLPRSTFHLLPTVLLMLLSILFFMY